MSDPTDPMRPRPLSLSQIQHIDNGKIQTVFNQLLRNITADVIDRPGDKSKRKLQLTVELSPVVDKETSALDTIKTEFVLKTALPVLRSAEYQMLAKPDGTQVFQPGSPFDPRQNTFDFGANEKIDVDTGEVTSTAGGTDQDDELESDQSKM